MDLKEESQSQYHQSLGAQVNTIEQEARMVLPGIQALFGFQMIAAFNPGFKLNLSGEEQIIHLLALLLVAVSAILVVAPAAYHRQARHQISKHFVKLSSAFLAWAMAPLALGTCFDIYLVARVILNSVFLSLIAGGFIFSIYLWIWFLLPRLHAKKVHSLPVDET